jgi:hypothetical protein
VFRLDSNRVPPYYESEAIPLEPTRFHSLCIIITFIILATVVSRDSSVDIVTGYGLEDGVQLPAGARDFSVLHSIQTGSGAYPAFCSVCTGECFSGVKWQ